MRANQGSVSCHYKLVWLQDAMSTCLACSKTNVLLGGKTNCFRTLKEKRKRCWSGLPAPLGQSLISLPRQLLWPSTRNTAGLERSLLRMTMTTSPIAACCLHRPLAHYVHWIELRGTSGEQTQLDVNQRKIEWNYHSFHRLFWASSQNVTSDWNVIQTSSWKETNLL